MGHQEGRDARSGSGGSCWQPDGRGRHLTWGPYEFVNPEVTDSHPREWPNEIGGELKVPADVVMCESDGENEVARVLSVIFCQVDEGGSAPAAEVRVMYGFF